jgi:hypothetical protein
MARSAWNCSQCKQAGACEICESCREHCAVDKSNDLGAHRKLDYVIASTDPKRQPN